MNAVIVTAIARKDIVDAMSVNNPLTNTDFELNFEPGRSIQIMKSINDFDNSITYKDVKYPLIAMLMPVPEFRAATGYYATVKIPRIIIATLTVSTDPVLTRYADNGTFKDILYPCYYEFLRRCAWSTSIAMGDPDALPHTKLDNPGQQPIGQGTTDYIDSIEIHNLELTLIQTKKCK